MTILFVSTTGNGFLTTGNDDVQKVKPAKSRKVTKVREIGMAPGV
jgi:hypothetical protein